GAAHGRAGACRPSFGAGGGGDAAGRRGGASASGGSAKRRLDWIPAGWERRQRDEGVQPPGPALTFELRLAVLAGPEVLLQRFPGGGTRLLVDDRGEERHQIRTVDRGRRLAQPVVGVAEGGPSAEQQRPDRRARDLQRLR